jgi:septum formation protein
MKGSKIILASTSPRRRDILKNSGYDLEERAPDAEEVHEGDPYEIVIKNAAAKAGSVLGSEGEIVIGADTLVLCDHEILGKPVDIDDARRMALMQLKHPQEVVTGLCVIDVSSGKHYNGFEISGVVMNGSEEDVTEHLESGQWEGKAGAYGIQDKGPLKASLSYGNEDNVVGLPVTLLERLLSLVGFDYPKTTPSSG